MAELTERVGEVIEASTMDFTAQCYELYQVPSLGSLVKTVDSPLELYGIVCHATTASLEPGRRPIARGRDEESEDAVYRANPQLTSLLRTEFSTLVVGFKENETLFQYLPPKPARIHGFVYLCSPDEVREFGQSFDFLNMLLKTPLHVPAEELIPAALRHLAHFSDDRHQFLVAAGKELAILLSGDFNRLKVILGRIK